VQVLRLILLAGLWLGVTAGTAFPQVTESSSDRALEASPAPAAPAAAAPSAEKSAADPIPWIPGDAIWLPADDGRLVPVPFGAEMKDFLKWLKDRQAPAADIPEFSITSLVLEGAADDDRATLRATFQIQVQRDNAWIRVPLRLDEAYLVPGARHAGAGEGSPVGGAAPGAGVEPGYAWYLKGRGLHELTLPLVVPLRKLPARRLELSLPAATASSLKLRVPLPHLRVTPQENSLVKTRSVDDKSTEVEVIGLGKRLDLRWLPQTETEASLMSATSIRLSLTRDQESVLLKANQKIQARQGSYQRIKVQLPPGFELQNGFEVQNGQPRFEGRQYSHEDVEADNAVTVELDEPTEGLVEMQWELEAPFPTNGQLSLSGFQVERARSQIGDIAISSADEFRISQLGGDAVRRVNASELPDRVQVDSAYKFSQQPFRLDLKIEEIEPQFTTEPVYYLHMAADRVELTADLRFTVHRGAVQDVELKWPGWRAEGWQIEQLRNAEGFAQDVEFVGESGNESVRIRVVDRSKREFRQTFRAGRRISGDGAGTLLSLPRVVATSPRAPILVIADAENVESKLEPVEGTTVRPLPAGRRRTIELPDELRELNLTELQIESQAGKFSAEVSVHERQVRAEATVVAELKENRLHVEERIAYDVRYESIAEIGLLAPKNLDRRVLFFLRGDDDLETPLNPIWTPQESRNLEKARFTLPEPRKGRFEVIARFEMVAPEELSAATDAPASLPVALIQSTDARIAPVRVEFKNTGSVDAAISDSAWVLQMPRSDAAATAWMTTAEAPAVPLQLSLSRRDALQDYSVRRGWIRTLLAPDGTAKVRAQYRLEGAVSTVELTLPPGSMFPHFWWDDRALSTSDQTAADVVLRGYRLKISNDVERGSHLLTVEYTLPMEGPLAWAVQRELSAPRFAQAVWTEQLLWQVVLPYEHYLWTYPSEYAPEFRWRRQNIFWSRAPVAPYDDPAEWIGASDGPDDPNPVPEGNSYAFSRGAPAAPLMVVALHQSMVVLFGAGLALALGFALIKMPALHTVLTPLLLAFVVAVLWLLAAAPMQLLLQPALLGFFLAVVAAFIDGAFKRDKSSVFLTLPPASDFASPAASTAPPGTMPSSSVNQPVILGAGSDDPTALRPASGELAESLSSNDTGMGR